MAINRAIISGNLTRDSELRATTNGTTTCTFTVAVNERRKNNNTGEWEDYPNFIDCVLFGSRGEKLNQYLTKGVKVAIEGKLRWSSWEDKQSGTIRSRIQIIVDEIELMSRGNAQNSPNTPQKASNTQYGSSQNTKDIEMADSDIPF